MKFVICTGRHLNIPKPNVEISEDEYLSSGINTPNIKYGNEVHSKQCDTDRQEFTISDSKGQDAIADNDSLGLSLLASKTVNLKKD